jgi:hypothetical protein
MIIYSKRAATPVSLGFLLCIGLIFIDLIMWIALGKGIYLIPVPVPFQLVMVSIFLFLFLKALGPTIVKYTDEGAVMEFFIDQPVLSFVNSTLLKRYDFPKKKLVSYSYKKAGLKKYLVLKLARSGNRFKVAKIPITFFSKQEKEVLVNAINTILEQNKNEQQQAGRK